MHLVNNVIIWIRQGSHGCRRAGGNPSPGASVRVAFDKDGLGGGARGADAGDSGLVEGGDKGVGHVVVFVVSVKDYVRVGFELRCYGFPEGFEAGGVRNYVAVVATFKGGF